MKEVWLTPKGEQEVKVSHAWQFELEGGIVSECSVGNLESERGCMAS